MSLKPELDPRWALVLAHAPEADGQFVYAVRTTGVYCRPSCGARRPHPEHVSFHANGAAARAAGFRPCRRCHPDQPLGAAPASAAVVEACRKLEQAAPGAAPALGALARACGLAPAALRRQFQAVTGLTPRAWAAAARDQRVRHYLRQGRPVTDSFYEAGFNSSGRFYAAANRALGMPPVRFRRGGAGACIRFGTAQCWLGAVLAAESDRGVCAILLGDGIEGLEGQLRALFPAATLVRGGAAWRRRLQQVLALVETPGRRHGLPLDLRGTAFERRVWRALQRVPAGTRLSYGALAQRLGMPHGARAVARACAHNRLAVVVPCHRAVRSDGALAGYRWGVERKRALLEREQHSRR